MINKKQGGEKEAEKNECSKKYPKHNSLVRK